MTIRTATMAQMKAIDEQAIHKLGIPSLKLMENAATQITRAAVQLLVCMPAPRVLVICGTGNNGGDGLACCRQLLSRGISASVILVGNAEKQTPDSKANAAALQSCGGDITPYTGQPLPGCDLIVDALFGFGLNREVSGPYREIIEKINAHPAPVIACDIPSGLDGDTGRVLGTAVKAAQTVCFTCAKPGLLTGKAAPYVGKLSVAEIGIPEALLK